MVTDSTQVTTRKIDLSGISPYAIVVLHFQIVFFLLNNEAI